MNKKEIKAEIIFISVFLSVTKTVNINNKLPQILQLININFI